MCHSFSKLFLLFWIGYSSPLNHGLHTHQSNKCFNATSRLTLYREPCELCPWRAFVNFDECLSTFCWLNIWLNFQNQVILSKFFPIEILTIISCQIIHQVQTKQILWHWSQPVMFTSHTCMCWSFHEIKQCQEVQQESAFCHFISDCLNGPWWLGGWELASHFSA